MSLAVVLLATGCAPLEPSVEQLHAANYGPQPKREDAIAQIVAYEKQRLIDPDSARFEFADDPQQQWETDGNKFYFGYQMFYTINARNRMGGYTGKRLYAMFFFNGKAIHSHEASENGEVWSPPLGRVGY